MLKRRLKLCKKSLTLFLEEFKEKKAGLLSLAVIVVLIIISAFPQFFTPYNPHKIVGPYWAPPSLSHPLGTDDVGKDVLSQIIYGARTSLIVGFFSALLAFAVGLIVGMFSGFYGGMIDEILMRITEFFLIIPNFPLMVVLAFILKPSLQTIIFAIAVTVWTQPVRVIRSEVLSLKKRLYITRAKVIGNSNLRILFKYILPRVLPLGLATMVIVMGWAIPAEAFLSWIGLGDPTHISWGIMLYYAFGRGSFTVGAWWHFIPPGLMILIVITSFTVLGHTMEEVINPKLRIIF